MEKYPRLSSLFPLLLCLLSMPRSSHQQLAFTEPNYSSHIFVFENATLGQVLTNITDKAPESEGRIVSVVYQGPDHAFYTSRVPGQPQWGVILNRTLDRESQFQLRITLQAQGQENVQPTDFIISLYVQDVNDNAPQFLNLPYKAEVDEDALISTPVNISIVATDSDLSTGGQVRFLLEDVSQGSITAGGSTFIMDFVTGRVTLNGSLDYEARTFYHYRVVAKDLGTPSLSTTTDLFITVKDVQDSPPVFLNIPYVASVNENTRVGTTVLSVRAVDQDRAIPNTVTYNITQSMDCPGLFEMDANNGTVYVSKDLDRDVPPLKDVNGRCTIHFQATEQPGLYPQKGNFTALATATISVDDVNDNAPNFSRNSLSARLNEGSPVGTLLQLESGQQIFVTDIDQGSNSAIHLALETEVDTFELTTSSIQSTGAVQLSVKNNTKLDYERVQTLTVKITANDNRAGRPPATATVTVDLENMNEYSPEFTQKEYTATVPEMSSPPTHVTTVNATDRDAGDYGRITYKLNNDRGLFAINNSTGEVSVASSRTDREREDRYYMMVVAIDGGGLQQTVPLTLTLADVNDNPPVFLRHLYDVILTENSRAFSRDVVVQATDADEDGTENANVTYFINHTIPTGLESSFHLDPFSGNLSIVHALDYDILQFQPSSAGMVVVVVVASDDGKPKQLSATATVVITLIDENDNAPMFLNVLKSATIPEGTSKGSVVISIIASDLDGSSPNNVITYSIESGGQDRFRIDPDSGNISVSGDLNREQVTNYTLVVMARDRAASPKTNISHITIAISDVNDERPSFDGKEDVRISVNETVQGFLYSMSAVDPDLNSALNYSVVYGASSAQPDGLNIQEWIRINASTGHVFATKPLSRLEVHTIVLLVRVTDINGLVNIPQTSDATLTITVEDINNHSPQFSPERTVTASIRENMGVGTALTFSVPLRVSDQDEGSNSYFEVKLTGENSQYFDVLPRAVQSSADLVIIVKNNSILDYERRTNLTMTLLATETKTNLRRNNTVKILLDIQDENDHSPYFGNETYSVTIPEASPAGTTVATITAIDEDGSRQFSTITYSLQGGNTVFSINPYTGVVTLLTNATDFDTLPNSYQLTLLASDSEKRRDNALLVVKLTDINDLSPQFDRPVFTARLREGQTEFESPLVLHAVDGDEPGTANSNVTYSILGSKPQGFSPTNLFLPNQFSGIINVSQAVDLEALPFPGGTILLEVQASDGRGRKTTASVEITVLDMNDHTPTFSTGGPDLGVISIPENTSVSATVVYTFNATDGDRTFPNNDVTYLIRSGANDQFSLDEQGRLSVSRGLDREEVNRYSLVVLALDKGVPQNTATATLTVDVTDVNDVSPKFVRSFVTINVDENTLGVVYTMNATDEDVDHQLQYEILWSGSTAITPSGVFDASSIRTLFSIGLSTGDIRVDRMLDRETLESAVLVVRVQDTASQTGLQTTTGTVTINVVDEDDNPPVFSNQTLAVSVDENSAQGVPINMPQITVSDRDQGENASFKLRVTDSVASTIEVVPSMADGSTVVVLRVGSNNSLLDFEQHHSLSFQIWAVGIKNRNRSGVCNVTLTINNLNDNLPQFQRQQYTANINESTKLGTTVTHVMATDKDEGDLGVVSYSLLGDSTLFSVNTTNGLITTSTAPDKYDFEKTPEYYLTVMATDGGGASTTTRVHVLLDDINDQAPVFQRSQYSAYLKENARTFDTGVTVKATDNDKENTPNSAVVYSLHGSSFFNINSTSGQLGIRSPVDYESVYGGMVNLTVIATDLGIPPLSSSVQIIVTVQDLNDFPPVFNASTYYGNVTEGMQNVEVLTVHATDADGSPPNNEIFYLLASGGNDRFKVDSSSGRISTLGDIDREARASYTLVVQAVDKGSQPHTASTTVIVRVDNVNDYPPRFSPTEVSVSVSEDRAQGYVVDTFAAIDNDEDALLRYAILWNLSKGFDEDLNRVSEDVLKGSFTLDSTNGNISVLHLDREVMETAILVIGVRDDNAPSNSLIQTATGTIHIKITDADDNPPSFNANNVTASILENSPEDIPIQLSTAISVTDRDKDANSEFRLSLSTDCLKVFPTAARRETTVVISVNRSSCFDYEDREHFDFEIFAVGKGVNNYSSSTTVHLNINNTNDVKPNFKQLEYSKSIPENFIELSPVITVQAADGDRPPFNAFNYSLQGGDSTFSINSSTGEVSVARAVLDYETRKQYQMTVEATDSGGLRDSVPLTISLTDLNDNWPVFDRREYQAFIDENSIKFDREINITATDRDEGVNQEITYSILLVTPLANNFTVDNFTGRLGVRNESAGLDYESLPDLKTGMVLLFVEGCDHGMPRRCSNVSVSVSVRDKNDNSPIFLQSYHGIIKENAPFGTSLLMVNATDNDGSAPNNKVFYIISGSGSDKFQVDSGSGLVTPAGRLDSDSQAFYNLTLSAIDGGFPSKSSFTFVTVQVLDVNDVAPEFIPESRSISVNESHGLSGADPGKVLTALNATDPDQDKDLHYDVIWSQCQVFGPNQERLDVAVLQNAIAVNHTSGEIRVNGTNLDRETMSRAVLMVNVTDRKADGPPQTATGSLTINVLDVNDHKPLFNRPTYTAQIAENAVEDTVLNIVSADQMNVTDLDTDQNCVFSITVDGPESAYFKAEPSSARSFALVQLRVRNGSVLDYETIHSITFHVTVRETATIDRFSDTVTVVVNITDVNDNFPTFGANFTVSVQENSPRGTNITTVKAIDRDSGSFGDISYSLEGDAAMFSIHPVTGTIVTVDGSLDRESRDTYLMTVVATDGGGRRTGAPLTITITDANDKAPRFEGNYSSRVRENSVHLNPPVVLQATDGDLADTANSNVTYHLLSCAPVHCHSFSVNEVTGELQLNTELDFEQTRAVQLVVVARDQGNVSLNGTATVSIQVEDVNDVDPLFTQLIYSVIIEENAEKGTHVGNVSATDNDGSSPNNVIFYVLDSGPGSDKFRVNSSTGVVTVGPGALLNRETDANFRLVLMAIDRGDPPRSSTATLSVSLRDVNDELPIFLAERKTVTRSEGLAVGSLVAVINASDLDDGSALVYSWVLNDSQATTDRDVLIDISRISSWFSVNANTGEVTVKSELDRELAEVIMMKIMVNDSNGVKNLPQTALATLTITLTDVNDNRPVIISESETLHVSEAAALGTEITSFTAMDADKDQTVHFTIVTEAEDVFSMSAAGKLSLQRSIDRETTPTVNFTLIATDDGIPSALSSNMTITVIVLDANDNDPQFQNTFYNFSVPEDAAVNTLVVILNATDRDQGANANVTFDFADNVYDFVINKTTGAIFVNRPLDRERQSSYSFGVAALDNPITDSKRRSIQKMTIQVTDINDNDPIFTTLTGQQAYTAQIDETKGPGNKVLSLLPGPVQAQDADEGNNSALTYLLSSQDNMQDYFRMDHLTGDIFVKANIRGQAGLYNYTIIVVDGGHPPRSASANLTIEVLDQNLNDPRFQNDYAHIDPIPECSAPGTSIVTLVAWDDDRNKETNGKVQYFFDNSTSRPADLPYFKLDIDTGLLTSVIKFNREQQAEFQIDVIAQDKGVPDIRYSKPLHITINIADENDNAPTFNITDYHFSVTEGQEGGNVVGQVYAQDTDDFKKTCYTLDGQLADYFNITSPTDQPADIVLSRPLDREDPGQASFTFTVTATDCTGRVGSCAVNDFKPVLARVHIVVTDVNDNPPNFTKPHLTFGLTSTADAGHLIAYLPEYVSDPDLGANSVHSFYPVGNYEMDGKLNASISSGVTFQPLALSINGSLTTRSTLPGDAEGFFTWTIMTNDSAGQDQVIVKIFVVGKDKLIKITFFSSMDELRQMQDEIVRDLSEQTGKQFIVDDRLPFEDNNGIDSSKSIMVVHAVDERETAMDANSLMDFLDHQVAATDLLKTRYKLYNIQTYRASEEKAKDEQKKVQYILAAIICVLVLAFLITLYLMLNNIRRFKLKLRAATIESYPMTKHHVKQECVPGLKTPQANPIFGRDEDLAEKEVDIDRISHHTDVSLDNNSVGFGRPSAGYNTEEELEVTLDLYGNDDDDKELPPASRRDHTFYLDQALSEHERYSKGSQSHASGMLDPKLSSDHAGPHLAQAMDCDIDVCESSDI